MTRHASQPPTARVPIPFDIAALDAALAAGGNPVLAFREALQAIDQHECSLFRSGTPSSELVPDHARAVDQLLERAWRSHFKGTDRDIALIAVGGYGRGELHHGSDIDLLLLLREEARETLRPAIEPFIGFLWDLGLEVGHSVRTVAECIEASASDITIETNLLEARLLCGADDLFAMLEELTHNDSVWTSRRFFEGKLAEQTERHAHYHDTGYNLEPNVKESPGGMRDIQMIGWVAKRHFTVDNLHDLVDREFLTEAEYTTLIEGQGFLWQVRFALHMLAGRREDRLLFDYQRVIAELLGYHDADGHLAVEQFMKQYYRVVMELSRLNEMLLQLFKETILYADDSAEPKPINRRFQVRRHSLEVTSDDIFERYPFALLELFLVMQQNPEIRGVRAETIRLVRDHRHLINEAFRRDIRARSLFMEILRQPSGITHELRRMNRYGILAAYLPAFGNIVGQMQYDLFHVYTVDEHTLRLIRNLRRFTMPKHNDEFPRCNHIAQSLPKVELLYLAGLFHDIAKGRGGDHSRLGAVEAQKFSEEHYLSPHDASLIAWLVANHLIMARTAQRKDISDPVVVNAFAQEVGDQVRLDYLYLLTIADIRATNPQLWTSWKETLLAELYVTTKRALRRGVEHPFDQQDRIRGVRALARSILKNRGLPGGEIDRLWAEFNDEYFLRHNADDIAWQSGLILAHAPSEQPLIGIRRESSRGGTAIFIYTRELDRLFALTTRCLEQLGLTVVDARIILSRSGHSMDTYIVLDQGGEPIEDAFRIKEIRERLHAALAREDRTEQRIARRKPRHLQHFPMNTRIEFHTDQLSGQTIMELFAADRPGLLSCVGQAFADTGLRLQNAKIGTFGNRAEDVFFITDDQNRPISDPQKLETLRETLLKAIDSEE